MTRLRYTVSHAESFPFFSGSVFRGSCDRRCLEQLPIRLDVAVLYGRDATAQRHHGDDATNQRLELAEAGHGSAGPYRVGTVGDSERASAPATLAGATAVRRSLRQNRRATKDVAVTLAAIHFPAQAGRYDPPK